MFVLRRTSEVNLKHLPPKCTSSVPGTRPFHFPRTSPHLTSPHPTPHVAEIILFCKPSELQLRLYKHFLDHPQLAGLRLRYSSTSVDMSNHLVFIGALRKLANTPQIIFDSAEHREDGAESAEGVYDGILQLMTAEDRANLDASCSGKMQVLADLLKRIRKDEPKAKVVVASNFTKVFGGGGGGDGWFLTGGRSEWVSH